MRVYIRMNEKNALKALAEGFWDMGSDECFGSGVWCDDRPRGGGRAAAGRGVMIGGPEGNVTLCVDVPEEAFRELEAQEATRPLTEEESDRFDDGTEPEGLEYQRMGYAVIPAATLNRFGRPQVWDHDYSGDSRVELVVGIRRWEASREFQAGEVGVRHHVQCLRDAMAFLDAVGWQAPLSLREEAPEDYAKPGPWARVDDVEEEDGHNPA